MSKIDTAFCRKACAKSNTSCVTRTEDMSAVRSCCNISDFCVPHELKQRVNSLTVQAPHSRTTSGTKIVYEIITPNTSAPTETRTGVVAASHDQSTIHKTAALQTPSLLLTCSILVFSYLHSVIRHSTMVTVPL